MTHAEAHSPVFQFAVRRYSAFLKILIIKRHIVKYYLSLVRQIYRKRIERVFELPAKNDGNQIISKENHMIVICKVGSPRFFK